MHRPAFLQCNKLSLTLYSHYQHQPQVEKPGWAEKGNVMSASFRGRITQIAGDLVQIWDARSGHAAYLQRDEIVGGADLRLNDEVVVEGDERERRGRCVSGTVADRKLANA